jgi:hypothetical protein
VTKEHIVIPSVEASSLTRYLTDLGEKVVFICVVFVVLEI